MGAEEEGELPTCPKCRITLMWPTDDGWQCEECQHIIPAGEGSRAQHGAGAHP